MAANDAPRFFNPDTVKAKPLKSLTCSCYGGVEEIAWFIIRG